jgi:hypothetical protein
MLKCKKCNGRVFIDRTFNSYNHIETFCIICGKRKFYHNFTESDTQAQWLLTTEQERAKFSISPF